MKDYDRIVNELVELDKELEKIHKKRQELKNELIKNYGNKAVLNLLTKLHYTL